MQKGAIFQSTFSFLDFNSTFVETFSTQYLLYRAFHSLITSIISNPTLKDCCCLIYYLLLLFIQIPIIQMRIVFVPFKHFSIWIFFSEFCAISPVAQSRSMDFPPYKGVLVSTIVSPQADLFLRRGVWGKIFQSLAHVRRKFCKNKLNWQPPKTTYISYRVIQYPQ